MRSLRSSSALAMVVILLFAPVVMASGHEGYIDIKAQCDAKVLTVVDGESLIVELTDTKEMAMVRMIGVDISGSDTAVKFLDAEILGKTVTLSLDPFIPSPEGRWSMVYIYTEFEMINRKMITQGHAKPNAKHNNALLYPSLTSDAMTAEGSGIGIWDDKSGFKNFSYASARININTASLYQLTAMLEGVDQMLAERITAYRKANPFRTIGDIKFVTGFSKEIFDKNRNIMAVSTNVSDASRGELDTLAVLSTQDIDRIMEYRAKKRIAKPDELVSIIGDSMKYEAIKKFVDTMQVTELGYSELAVNINTSDTQLMITAGLNHYHASLLVSTREMSVSQSSGQEKVGYTLKTLGELMYFPGISLTFEQINALEGRLRLKTEINKAPYNEFLSLNTSITLPIAAAIVDHRPYRGTSEVRGYLTDEVYRAISKHIYIGSDFAPSRVNINTATKEQMIEAGFTSDLAAALITRSGRMRNIQDIPVILGDLDQNTALYTNINKAGLSELLSLNYGMTTALATDIISYRENQPIGSMDELRQIFIERDALSAYDFLKSYMVLR